MKNDKCLCSELIGRSERMTGAQGLANLHPLLMQLRRAKPGGALAAAAGGRGGAAVGALKDLGWSFEG